MASIEIELDDVFLDHLEASVSGFGNGHDGNASGRSSRGAGHALDSGDMQNNLTSVQPLEGMTGARLETDGPYARRLYHHPEYNFQTGKQPPTRRANGCGLGCPAARGKLRRRVFCERDAQEVAQMDSGTAEELAEEQDRRGAGNPGGRHRRKRRSIHRGLSQGAARRFTGSAWVGKNRPSLRAAG